MTITEDLIKSEISKLPTYSDDHLIYMWKICSSRKSVSDQKLLRPLQLAIEKQRKLNGKAVSEVSDEPTLITE